MSKEEPRYIEAIGRNTGEELQHSHLYEIKKDGYLPICIYGWNRSDGQAFSIFRGHTGARGLCEICRKRAAAGKHGISWRKAKHKTKWI